MRKSGHVTAKTYSKQATNDCPPVVCCPSYSIGTGTGASLRRDIPLAQKTVRKLPFPRVLFLQGGSLTGLVCTAMQADAPASLPTPIFFTVCFASPKNRLYSAQPPLGRTLDGDVWTLDDGRWTRNARRLDGGRWTRVPVARLSQLIRLFPGLSRLKCTLPAALTVREKRNRR